MDRDRDRQTGRQADRQANRQADRQAQTDRQAGRQTDSQTDRHTDTDTQTHIHTNTHRHTHTDIQTDRHTYIRTYVYVRTDSTVHICHLIFREFVQLPKMRQVLPEGCWTTYGATHPALDRSSGELIGRSSRNYAGWRAKWPSKLFQERHGSDLICWHLGLFAKNWVTPEVILFFMVNFEAWHFAQLVFLWSCQGFSVF